MKDHIESGKRWIGKLPNQGLSNGIERANRSIFIRLVAIDATQITLVGQEKKNIFCISTVSHRCDSSVGGTGELQRHLK